jgi:hypothetical protein
MLCESCVIAISDILSCNLDSSRWDANQLGPSRLAFPIGDNRKLVEKARLGKCTICHCAYKWLSSPFFTPSVFESVNAMESTPYFLSVPFRYANSNPHQRWSICIGGEPTLNPQISRRLNGPSVTFELYLCEPSAEGTTSRHPHQLNVNVSPELLSRLGTHINGHSGSESSLGLISGWSSQCARFHPQCAKRNQSHRLPTRVIDLGLRRQASATFKYPRVVLTHGKRGHYIALSHR